MTLRACPVCSMPYPVSIAPTFAALESPPQFDPNNVSPLTCDDEDFSLDHLNVDQDYFSMPLEFPNHDDLDVEPQLKHPHVEDNSLAEDAIMLHPKVEPTTATDHGYELHVKATPEFDAVLAREKRTMDLLIEVTGCCADPQSTSMTHDTDMVIVLDVSGSMGNGTPSRISCAIDSIKFIANQLGVGNRMCLVTFNHAAQQRTGFWNMTDARKAQLTAILDSIAESGGTKIETGIDAALGAIRTREHRAALGNIVLLTDGHNNEQMAAHAISSWKRDIGVNCSISTIGYGSDHDVVACSTIAKECRGAYYFVESAHNVGPAMAKLLGTTTSVIANNVILTVNQFNPHRACCEGPRFSNVRSAFPNTINEHGVTVRIPDIAMGETKFVLVSVQLGSIDHPHDTPINDVAIQAVYTIAPLFSVAFSTGCLVPITRPLPRWCPGECVTTLIKPSNPNVVYRRLIWRVSGITQQAAELVSNKHLDNARVLLEGQCEELKSFIMRGQCEVTSEDLDRITALVDLDLDLRDNINRIETMLAAGGGDSDQSSMSAMLVSSAHAIGTNRATFQGDAAIRSVHATATQESQATQYADFCTIPH